MLLGQGLMILLKSLSIMSEYRTDEIFRFEVPKSLPAIDSRLLDPIQLWNNKEEFKKTKENLAKMFIDNFNRFGSSLDNIKKHGPQSL